MLDLVRLYLLGFGALTILGGLAGFVRAKSRASLVAGAISGGLLLVAGYLAGSTGRPGLLVGFAVSAALAGRFATTYRRSKKLMPAGLMTVLGLAGVALTALALLGR